jgi:uncharacterized metal-binding protein YceD (DUF177 family)
MKINRAVLTNGATKEFEESIDFSRFEFDPTHIKSIPSCVVKARATDYETILRVEVEINALVIGVCCYSLEDVELKFKINDELCFTDDEDDVDNYYEKGNIIELDEYILGILLANVPIKIVKKGAKIPENGKGYRVITEDDYEEEKSKKVDHRFDILDTVEFSDD